MPAIGTALSVSSVWVQDRREIALRRPSSIVKRRSPDQDSPGVQTRLLIDCSSHLHKAAILRRGLTRSRRVLPNLRRNLLNSGKDRPRDNDPARSVVEPIRFSTGSNVRALDASPNHNQPTPGRCGELRPSQVAPCLTQAELRAQPARRSQRSLQPTPIRERASFDLLPHMRLIPDQ
jgi:hypothetical protein